MELAAPSTAPLLVEEGEKQESSPPEISHGATPSLASFLAHFFISPLYYRALLFLVLIALVSNFYSTEADLPASTVATLQTIDFVISLIFGFEFFLRLLLDLLPLKNPPSDTSGYISPYPSVYAVFDLASFLPCLCRNLLGKHSENSFFDDVDDVVLNTVSPAMLLRLAFVEAMPSNTQFLRLLTLFQPLQKAQLEGVSFFQKLLVSKLPLLKTSGFCGAAVWVICSALYYIFERDNERQWYCPAGLSSSKNHASKKIPCYNRFRSIPDSMFMALQNFLGEYPLMDDYSTPSRFVAVFIQFVGAAVIAIPAGVMGSAFSEVVAERAADEGAVEDDNPVVSDSPVNPIEEVPDVDPESGPNAGARPIRVHFADDALVSRPWTDQLETGGSPWLDEDHLHPRSLPNLRDPHALRRRHLKHESLLPALLDAFFGKGYYDEQVCGVLVLLSVAHVVLSTVATVAAAQRGNIRLHPLFEHALTLFDLVNVLAVTIFFFESLWRWTKRSRTSVYPFCVRGLVDVLAWLPPLMLFAVTMLDSQPAKAKTAKNGETYDPFHLLKELEDENSGHPATDKHFRVPKNDPNLLQVLRALSLLRIFKLDRFLNAFQAFASILAKNKSTFSVTGFLAMFLWLTCSFLMYLSERSNPDPMMRQYYTSAPTAMWVTLLNLTGESPLCNYQVGARYVQGFMGLVGVAFVTIPMGVLGAGFQEWLEDQEEAPPALEENKKVEQSIGVKANDENCEKLDTAIVEENGPTKPADAEAPTKLDLAAFTPASERKGNRLRLAAQLRDPKLLLPVPSRRAVVFAFLQGNAIALATPFAKRFEQIIFLLIFVTSTIAALETVDGFAPRGSALKTLFDAIELVAVFLFTLEYTLRLYAAPEDPSWAKSGYTTPGAARLAFSTSLLAVVDLMAILPYYLASAGSHLADRHDGELRMLRVLRLLTLDKYVPSVSLIGRVVKKNGETLRLAGYAALCFWLSFAGALWITESGDSSEFDEEPMAERYRNVLSAMPYTLVNKNSYSVLNGQKLVIKFPV